MMKKSAKLALHVVSSNIAIIIALVEKIYDREPILTVISNNGEEVQFRCFNLVYDVKKGTHPDTIPLLGNNY
jgi:hypothetical protein